MPFERNNTANLAGRPRGSQGFVDRANFLLGKYTVGEVLDMANNEQAFRKLSTYDGMIMRRICEAFAEDGNASMNSLLDRIIGKPVQPVAQKVEVGLSQDTLAAMREVQALSFDELQAIREIVNARVPALTIDNTPAED